MGKGGYTVVDYDTFVTQTDLAWGVTWDDIEGTQWFPKSQCTNHEDTKTLEVPDWLWEIKESQFNYKE